MVYNRYKSIHFFLFFSLNKNLLPKNIILVSLGVIDDNNNNNNKFTR